MIKIFVSHAHEDKDAAHQITIALAKAGFDPWLDAQELCSGDELLKTIATVLDEAQYFAIVLSHTALTKRWVLAKMRMALTSEIEKGHPKMVVLRLDDCEIPIELRGVSGLPRQIRRRSQGARRSCEWDGASSSNSQANGPRRDDRER